MKTDEYQRPIRYDWERPDFDPSQDEFMKHFDENGNFAPIKKEPVIEELPSYFTSDFNVFYEIIEAKKADDLEDNPDRKD